MEITSRDNETFKNLLKLTEKKWRRKFGLCIVEGEKAVKDNLCRAEKIFMREGRGGFENAVELSGKLFDEVSSLETDQGVLATVKIPPARAVTFPYLVLDGIQDSGNMGTLLRTAAAFGFETVFCIDCVDVWSQKVLRASSGISFALNIIECGEFVKPQGGVLIGADLHGKKISPVGKNFGIVLGSEGKGLSGNIKTLIDKFVTIPMNPGVESLNVAVAGGILMYELKGAIK
jgi:TrmH family RNA methyltransferase